MLGLMLACVTLCGSVCAAAEGMDGRISPAVVLSWDDTGDFGPQTPGTKTAGWQEAIDYCVATARDLYVKGGWGGRKPVYHVSETIRIPATQDFRIDGGIYVVNWTGAPDDPAKDLMVVDSTMNGEYHLGILVYGGAGAALRIRPENPVPIDNVAVFVESAITSQGMADPQPFTPGERKAGTGLVLDGTKASITCSRFDFIGGILNFKTCIESKGDVTQNRFSCLHLHTNADNSALFMLGEGTAQNVFQFAMGVDMGAGGVDGIVISGSQNTFEINTRGGFPAGHEIILEGPATGNRIDITHGRPEIHLAEFVTDRASAATNQVTWSGGNLAPSRVTTEAGTHTYTQRLYPATVRFKGGKAAAAQLLRGDVSVDVLDSLGAGVLLSVGDRLQIESGEPAELLVVPFKVR